MCCATVISRANLIRPPCNSSIASPLCYNRDIMPLDVALNDVVRLRKPHPCGGYEWTVVRLGADIGIVCNTCKHKVLLPRREFEKRVKKFVFQAPRETVNKIES